MPTAPSKSTVVINDIGQWLNGDAAASYLRAIAGGCPKGGISSKGAGRTEEDQEYLYNGWIRHLPGFNRAARPGTSLHEVGNALDLKQGTSAQAWMTVGGDPRKVKSGEKIRANEFGWFRTVSDEPWHFAYNRAKDKRRAADLTGRLKALGYSGVLLKTRVKAFQSAHGLTADGVDGPLTWARLLGSPKPAASTPKPVPVATLARVGTFNCGAWGKTSMTAKQINALVAAIGRINASMLALTECPEWLRHHLRGTCRCKAGTHKTVGNPKYWRVAIRGAGYSQAILFDNRKWVYRSAVAVRFGPTDYHGGLVGFFTQATTKATLAFGAYHLPPNSVSSDSFQISALAKLIAKMPTSGARVLAGDGADESGWAKGWSDSRVVAKESPSRTAATYGKAIRDRIHVLGMTVRKYSVVPSAGASDHQAVLAQITIPATVPST
ncbi:MAG: peptidoglycan-binding protein [Propionicimonas sp.]|nr:peptidoglycan-binding protein [Propionicimonas sp.]